MACATLTHAGGAMPRQLSFAGSSWQSATQFALSPEGITAVELYRSCAVGSPPRVGPYFEGVRRFWAESQRLHHDDTIYLGEVLGGAKTVEGIVEALRACGRERDHSLAALRRLLDAGLISITSLP